MLAIVPAPYQAMLILAKLLKAMNDEANFNVSQNKTEICARLSENLLTCFKCVQMR